MITYPDNIPPEIGLPLAAVLWGILAALKWSERKRP